MSIVSTLSASNMLRAAMSRTQTELARAQQEAGSGRLADAGLALGAGVSRTIDLRAMIGVHEGYAQANALTGDRLDASQNVLAALADLGDRLRNDVLTASNTSDASVATAAGYALSSAVGALNTRFAGEYLFAGVDVDKQPIASPAQGAAATEAAFLAAFGVAPGSAGAAAISPAAMQQFLDTQFSALFSPTGWSANWSQASDTPIVADVAPGRRLDASATANEQGVRKLVEAAAMLAHIGIDALGAGTRRVVLDQAARTLGGAATGLTQVQARLGIVQREATSASDAVKAQKAYLETQIGQIENVDPADAATRISLLTTQLETTYSLTARARQMSLLNYL